MRAFAQNVPRTNLICLSLNKVKGSSLRTAGQDRREAGSCRSRTAPYFQEFRKQTPGPAHYQQNPLSVVAIGYGNVSILLLARGTARQHEFAVRAAVGASSGRIVRQLLTESLILALTGAGLGVSRAWDQSSPACLKDPSRTRRTSTYTCPCSCSVSNLP